MRASRISVTLALAVGLLCGATACTSAPAPGGAPGTTATSAVSASRAAFDLDTAASAKLAVGANGGGTTATVGVATAVVWVPAGAVPAGTEWEIVPLATTPGNRPLLISGFYADTKGVPPTKPCKIAFSMPGKDSLGKSVIVRYDDDGKGGATPVPTVSTIIGDKTVLSATVDGFSAYGVGSADLFGGGSGGGTDSAAATASDWTIKAGGTETQTNQGWTFEYELDFFASGAGVDVGGIYKGHASLSVKGTYKGPASIVKTMGKLSGIGRDQKLGFTIIDFPLADLLTGKSVENTEVGGSGVMNLSGMGSLDISAVAPTVKGKYSKKNEPGKGAVPFTIVVKGEDVQIEIANVGIFPGKILRTSK